MHQILAFHTQTDDFEASQFMRILIGNIGQFDISTFVTKFSTRFPNGASADEIKGCVRLDVHTDLGTGIQLYIDTYVNAEGKIGYAEFALILQDLYASSPEQFAIISGNIWFFE